MYVCSCVLFVYVCAFVCARVCFPLHLCIRVHLYVVAFLCSCVCVLAVYFACLLVFSVYLSVIAF